MTLLRVEAHGGVRLLTLNDPKRRNLLSGELCRQISGAVAEANADPEAKAIVITGAPPAFCAGANLEDLEAAADGDTEAVHAVYRSFVDVANSPLPTIAAVNGVAVGAGLNLALACDVRLASRGAMFDCRFLKIGLHPGGGHSWMLQRAVGWSQAAQMLLLDRALRADEALQVGLVQQVADEDDLRDHALALGQRTETLPRDLITRTKETMRLAAASDHASAFARETDEQLDSLRQPAFKALVTRLKGQMGSR